MTIAEKQRLDRDVAADPALRGRLAPAFDPAASPADITALLAAEGYRISESDLPLDAAPRPLDEAALGRVAGGFMPVKNFNSPFDPE
ncbi:Nif11 family protein [Roseomonas sp. F4]